MNKEKSFLGNKTKRGNFKTTMAHIKGLPPSPNWSNRFTAITHNNNLLYLCGSSICNIDLTKKEFFQLLNCNQLEFPDKPGILTTLDAASVLVVSTRGYFVIYHTYNNPNDTRIYFKELKEFFKFVELDATPKSIINVRESRMLFVGSSTGQLLAFSYEFRHSNSENKEIVNSDIKFQYEISLGLNNYTTDIRYYAEWGVVMLSTFNGEFYMYRFGNKSLEKVIEIETDRKTIFSFDFVISDDIMKVTTVDKNGTMCFYEIIRDDEGGFKCTRLYYEKNRFNDKGIEEKFVMFTTKIVQDVKNGCFNIIITSNRGKVFYASFPGDENGSKPNFKELSDNPHTMAIFNILSIESKIYLVSADWVISCFNNEFIFESDIRCLGTKPKSMKIGTTASKNLYLLSEDSQLYRYNYTKTINGLSSSLRKLSKHGMRNPIAIEQAKFNENIFAILDHDESYTIYIYDFNTDMVINKFTVKKKPSCMVFSSKRKYMGNLFTNDKVNKTVNELFSEIEEYDLLYIGCSSEVIVWDYIADKFNRVDFDCQIGNGVLLPLGNQNEDIMLMNFAKNKIKLFIFNQMLAIELISLEHNATEGNHCDYFLTEENFFIFAIENQHDLKLISFCKDYIKELKNNDDNILDNYSSYTKRYNKLTAGVADTMLTVLFFKGFTNSVISSIAVLKEYCIKDDQLLIRFAVSHIDGVIKVYEIVLGTQLKLLLRYSINAHLSRITEILWLGNSTIASISLDHSLKLWNILLCKDVDLLIEHRNNTHIDNKPDSHKLVNNFIKINSSCLFQQSYKASQAFTALFEKEYTDYNPDRVKDISDIEFNLFSLHRDTGLNYLTACKAVEYELLTCCESLNYNKVVANIINLLLYRKYFGIDGDTNAIISRLKDKVGGTTIKIENVVDILENYTNADYLSEKYSNVIKVNYFILIKEGSYREAIDLCLSSQCFIDAIVIYKLSCLDTPEVYFDILTRLRGFIYSKFIFQAQKLQKVIDTLRNYFK
jgi:hypothetical protein